MSKYFTVSGFRLPDWSAGHYEEFDPGDRGHRFAKPVMNREVLTASHYRCLFVPEVETLYTTYITKGKVDAELIIDTIELAMFAMKKLKLRQMLNESITYCNPGYGLRDSFIRDIVKVALTSTVTTNASVYSNGVTPVGEYKHMPRTPSDVQLARDKTNIAALGALTDKNIVSSLLSATDEYGSPVGVPYTLGTLRYVFGISFAESI